MKDISKMTVVITIDGNPTYARTATNIGNVGKCHKYMCDDGICVLHADEDNEVKLAIKILENIKEVKK